MKGNLFTDKNGYILPIFLYSKFVLMNNFSHQYLGCYLLIIIPPIYHQFRWWPVNDQWNQVC